MKNFFISILFILSLISCSSQKKTALTEINTKTETQKGKDIVFVKLINDSRCPEGAQCIWAGEVTFEVAAYENGKLVLQQQLTLRPTNQEEITTWFKDHLSESNKTLKGVSILPYPKEGVAVKLEDYTFQLNY